jgi:hypothetical protein
MFKKLLSQLDNAKQEIEAARLALAKETKAANALVKEGKQLLSKIEMAQKQGGVLLLSEVDAGLIEKLQALTPDDNIVLLFTPDGSRIEIKHKDTNYSIDKGRIR